MSGRASRKRNMRECVCGREGRKRTGGSECVVGEVEGETGGKEGTGIVGRVGMYREGKMRNRMEDTKEVESEGGGVTIKCGRGQWREK